MKSITVVFLFLLPTIVYSQNFPTIENMEKDIKKIFGVDITSGGDHQEEFVKRFEQIEKQAKLFSVDEYWIVDTAVNLSTGISEKFFFSWDEEFNLTSLSEQFLVDSGWQNRNRTRRLYDSAGIDETMIYENWNDSVWINSKKIERYEEPNDSGLVEVDYIWQDSLWRYDTKTSILEYHEMRILVSEQQLFHSGKWVNYQQEIVQLNEINRPVMRMLMEGTADGWENVIRQYFDYDDIGRPVSLLLQRWRNNSWENSQKITYAYNTIEKIDTLVMQLFQDSCFAPHYRLIITRDNMKRKTQQLSHRFVNGKWRNMEIRSVIYYQDTYNPTAQISEYWIDSVNTLLTRLLYTYNSRGHQTGVSYEEYAEPEWILNYKNEISYDDGHMHAECYRPSEDTTVPVDAQMYIYGPLLSYSYNPRGYQLDIYYHTYTPVDVDDKKNVPTDFALAQNFPNPFNPVTKISFTLPAEAVTSLKIYDILGQEVEVLVSGELSPGKHIYTFDASHLASGVYLYRLKSGDFTMTKKMMLLK